MPLFDYRCRRCQHQFETLVRGGVVPRCSACGSDELEQLPSVFAVASDGRRATARARAMPKAVAGHREREKGELEDFDRSH